MGCVVCCHVLAKWRGDISNILISSREDEMVIAIAKLPLRKAIAL